MFRTFRKLRKLLDRHEELEDLAENCDCIFQGRTPEQKLGDMTARCNFQREQLEKIGRLAMLHSMRTCRKPGTLEPDMDSVGKLIEGMKHIYEIARGGHPEGAMEREGEV